MGSAVDDRSHDPAVLTERYSAAVELARRLHHDDVRKGTSIPYLAHVLSVSAIVLEHGGSEDQAIAALLHDTAEDHGGAARIDAIVETFGGRVGAIVAACSDSLTVDPGGKAPWWDRKIGYLNHLATASDAALLVSAADKLHNARSILADYRTHGDDLWTRFNSGLHGSLWYYRRLAEIVAGRLDEPPASRLAELLATTVAEICHVATAHGHDVEAIVAAGCERERHARTS